MNHGSLFNGIGGFQLAAEWMGWKNVFSSEIDSFCNRITKYYWPNCIQHGDIHKTDFTIYRGTIDVVTGGFPCQPYSVAGKRKGKTDERHLWPEMLRAIREIQPDWVVPENVHGFINWSRGMVFDEVQTDLETAFKESKENLEREGYDVVPIVLPACAKDAPHIRNRIWFVAHARNNGHGNGFGKVGQTKENFKGEEQRKEWNKIFGERNRNNIERIDASGNAANTTFSRMEGNRSDRKQESQSQIGQGLSGCNSSRNNWEKWPTQPPICDGNDGISTRLDLTTISKRKWIEESLKAGGNAIVPQVAFELFKAIETYNVLQTDK